MRPGMGNPAGPNPCSGSPSSRSESVNSIAAARDGNGGTVGIAPGAPIYGFRVLNDDGAGTTEDAIAAIEDKEGHPPRVLATSARSEPGREQVGYEAESLRLRRGSAARRR